MDFLIQMVSDYKAGLILGHWHATILCWLFVANCKLTSLDVSISNRTLLKAVKGTAIAMVLLTHLKCFPSGCRYRDYKACFPGIYTDDNLSFRDGVGVLPLQDIVNNSSMLC